MLKDSKVYLAPLEGLADGPMREVLCAHGGYDLCFSEFIRITDIPVAEKTLIREIPEFLNDCKTPDGTDLRVQFLGDNPKTLAASALKAHKLGAKSIDINFGCPSRFVHHSGAMLLKEPELMHSIMCEVREALPSECELSAKVRLGFADKSEASDVIRAVAVDGVKEITVHCRTRKDLYKEEALDWSAMRPLHSLAPNAVLIANGNINSLDDAIKCREITLCNDFMCGRGAFAIPNLGHVIKEGAAPFSVVDILKTDAQVIEVFGKTSRTEKMIMDRAKQFLGYARVHRRELNPFFKVFCKCVTINDGLKLLNNQIKVEEQNINEKNI